MELQIDGLYEDMYKEIEEESQQNFKKQLQRKVEEILYNNYRQLRQKRQSI